MRRSITRVRPAPSPSQMQEAEAPAEKREAPFVILGGGGWDRDATLKLQKWLEAHGLPVGTSFRCQDLFDNRSPSYAGDVGIGINPKLAQRVKEADVLLVIGARLGEMTTSAYTLLEAPLPRQTLIHVHAGAEELGRVYRPALRDQLRLCRSSSMRLDKLVFRECRLERQNRRRPQGIPGMDRAAADARARCSTASHPLALGQAARGRDRHQRRGQLRRLAAPPFPLQGLPHAARLDQRLDGLRLSGGGRGQARRAGAHACSRSAATATS